MSRVKLYQELGLEKLSPRRWVWRLYHYYKSLINRSPSYLYSILPQPTNNIQARSASRNSLLKTRTPAFQNSYFTECNMWMEWFNINIRGSTSFVSFKKTILKEIRPSPNSVFGIYNPRALKFLTRLRMSFSHLREHKFKYKFHDTLDPFCNCGIDIETTAHFFLHCQPTPNSFG